MRTKGHLADKKEEKGADRASRKAKEIGRAHV